MACLPDLLLCDTALLSSLCVACEVRTVCFPCFHTEFSLLLNPGLASSNWEFVLDCRLCSADLFRHFFFAVEAGARNSEVDSEAAFLSLRGVFTVLGVRFVSEVSRIVDDGAFMDDEDWAADMSLSVESGVFSTRESLPLARPVHVVSVALFFHSSGKISLLL